MGSWYGPSTTGCRRELTRYSFNATENSGPLKQRRFLGTRTTEGTRSIMYLRERLSPLDSLTVTPPALKVTFKIRGVNFLLRLCQSRNNYKTTPNRIGLKRRIALSIRSYESQMMEKRSLKLLI
ncbi:hypothetical protein TSAR_005699, partial [Trichomalopsis sarcophagae]